MIIVDILIVLIVIWAGYRGSQRGVYLLTLEISSFFLATLGAASFYRSLGPVLKSILTITTSLANVGAFLVIWMVIELTCGFLFRLLLLSRFPQKPELTLATKIGGGVLSGFKMVFIIAVSIVLFNSLPITSSSKDPVIKSYIAQKVIASNFPLLHNVQDGLGRDLGQSFNFFTIPTDPESQVHVDLGFKTTNVAINTNFENQMLLLLNQKRTMNGLPILTMHPGAQKVARAYSERMFKDGYFSHIDPDGHNPFDRMKADGIHFGAAGENLALAPTVEQADIGLFNSPGHRANILSKSFRQVGIGVVESPQNGLMITEDFTD